MREVVVILIFLSIGARLDGSHALLSVFRGTTYAQIVDDFDDEDFERDPAWVGDVEAWKIEQIRGDAALVSNGAAASDTIYLAVPLTMSFGEWTFAFSHRRVNLSTFNGARVFVCAVDPSVRTHPTGYYVQFGTNNGDAVSLWRVDGDWSTRRELGRSVDPLVAGDSSHLNVAVLRDPSTGWQVSVDGAAVVAAEDDTYETCTHLALWVKHTSAGRASFVFDAFEVKPVATPPQPPRPEPYDVIVNEIQIDPPPSGSEFVELYNRRSTAFPLHTLTMRDAVAAPVAITKGPAVLRPGDYAVVVQDGPLFQDQFRTIPYVTTRPWPTLNNGGDAIVLEADGVTIDSVSYVAGDILPDHSLERIDPDGPSDQHNFAPSSDPFGATPGARNSRFARDTKGPRLTFVKEVDDGVLDLYFDEPVREDSTPAGSVSADGILATSIMAIASDHVRAVFDGRLDAASVEINAAVDLGGNRSDRLTAPISYRPRPSDVVVNEILYEPVADHRDGIDDQVEFIEILNRSGRRLHLDGLFRTRDPDEHGDADTVRVQDSLVAFDPDMHLVLAADSVPAALPTLALPSLTLLNRGDRIRLHSGESVVLDDVHYVPSWHHPDLLDHRGVSLERIDAHAPGSDPDNWTSSVGPGGGTPGLPNSVRLKPDPETAASGLTIAPNPFSPDRDGVDDVVKFTYVPSARPARVRLRIFDLSGLVVREIVSSQLVAEPVSFLWDGRDEQGRRLPTGIYVAFVEAYDARNGITDTLKRPVVLARRY